MKTSEKVYSADFKGTLNPKYKKVIITSLYGLIEGSIHNVVKNINKSFERQGLAQPTIIAIQKDGRTENDFWAGLMDITIHYDNCEFFVRRDWFSEYEVDKLHPNFQDDYFYETEDAEHVKRWKTLYEQNNIEWTVS